MQLPHQLPVDAAALVPVKFHIGTQAERILQPGAGGEVALLVNRGGYTVYVGDSTVTGNNDGIPVPPLGTLALSTSVERYAVADPAAGTNTVDVWLLPAGIGYTPSPSEIAAQIAQHTLTIAPVEITGPVDVAGPVAVTGTVDIGGPVDVAGPVAVTGTVDIGGPVTVAGDVGITGPVGVSGAVGISGPVGITGPVSVQGTLTNQSVLPGAKSTVVNTATNGSNIPLTTTVVAAGTKAIELHALVVDTTIAAAGTGNVRLIRSDTGADLMPQQNATSEFRKDFQGAMLPVGVNVQSVCTTSAFGNTATAVVDLNYTLIG